MSQTNTNTNTAASNTGQNQITGRGGLGRGGSGGRGCDGRGGDCGNNSIAKYLFGEKIKRWLHFQNDNYRNQASSHSIQEDY